jgi:hypothetical protein
MERYSPAHYLAILVSLSARDMPLILIMTDFFSFAPWVTGNGPLRQRNRALVLSLGLGTLQAQTPVNSPRIQWNSTPTPQVQWVVLYSIIQYDSVQQTPREQGACMSLTYIVKIEVKRRSDYGRSSLFQIK